MSTVTQHSKRVLVADDDPVIRLLVTSAVHREGFDIVVVNDGREAYRILQSDADFKAAIFDMMVPRLKGLDIVRFMRTEKRLMRIPALMITSEQDLKLMSDSFSAGAALFLRKPFTAEQLQTTLRILLSTSSPARKAA
jgi:DNA-binding response OmpR family regulator